MYSYLRGSNRLVALSISLGLFVFLFILLFQKFFLPISPQDEGILLVYPDLILRGFVPNRDFATLYPPGNFWLLSLFFDVFEPSILVERAIGFIYLFGIVLSIFFLARRVGLRGAILSAVLSCLIIAKFPLLGAFSWFGGVSLSLCALAITAKSLFEDQGIQGKALAMVGGVFAGAAMLFRHDLGPVIILSNIVMIGIVPRTRVYAYLGGICIGLSPLIIHTAFSSITLVFDNLVLDVLRVGPGRRLPLNLKNPTMWLVVLSGIGSFVVGIVALFKNKKENYRRFFLAIGIFSIGLLPQALQRADSWHLLYVGCITIPLFFLALLGLWKISRKSINKGNPIKGIVGLILLALSTLWIMNEVVRPIWWKISEYIENDSICVRCVQSEDRWVPVRSDTVVPIEALINDVKQIATPGNSLFVGPKDLSRTNYGDTFLYFLLPELRPASYYLEMNPGSANRPESRLSKDISEADILILNEKYDEWNEANASKKQGSKEPNKIVAEKFCRRTVHGTYSLYVRCKRGENSGGEKAPL